MAVFQVGADFRQIADFTVNFGFIHERSLHANGRSEVKFVVEIGTKTGNVFVDKSLSAGRFTLLNLQFERKVAYLSPVVESWSHR